MNRSKFYLLLGGGIVLLGALIATQYFAWACGYHPAIGESLSLFGVKFYSPVKLLSWHQQYSTEFKPLRYSYYIFFGFVALGPLVPAVANRVSYVPNIFGDSRWATRGELERMKLHEGVGVFLGETKQGKYIRHEGPEHCAVIAPTRSGKGVGIIIPTLLTWRGSTIVYDLKEENFKVTANERSKFSDILNFKPNDPDTCRFNPLLEVRPGVAEIRDVQNIANMIIEPEREGAVDHWIRTGRSLLTATILHVLYTAEPEKKTLAGVTSCLSNPHKSLTSTLKEMLTTKHIRDAHGNPSHPHPLVQEAVRDVLNKSQEDRSSVHSTVMGYLDLYRDPLLASATSCSDFTINELVNGERPKTLYLVIPPADIERLRPLIRLIVNQICRRLTEDLPNPEDMKKRHKCLLMLDEFTALEKLEFFESSLAFIAGYGLRAMIIVQSLNQLKKVYGEKNSLLDNTHVKVFYTPETYETADYLEKTLGKTTVEYKTDSASGKKGAIYLSGKSESTHFSARSLMTSREILEMPKTENFILIGHSRPIRARKILYYEDENFKRMLGQAPRIRRTEEIIQKGESIMSNNYWVQLYKSSKVVDYEDYLKEQAIASSMDDANEDDDDREVS